MKELFSGYILAGGKSSRMGTDKAFLKIADKTFIENAVEILAPVCEQVKIVLNKSQTHFIEKLPAKIPHIFDIYENRGALGGIHAAFQDCRTEFVVILAVDLPFVTSEAIEKLCEIAVESKDFSAIVPRQIDGKLQPLCAVYKVENCLPSLEPLIYENDSASVQDFLEMILPRLVDQNKLTTDESDNIFFNFNHPADFQRLK